MKPLKEIIEIVRPKSKEEKLLELCQDYSETIQNEYRKLRGEMKLNKLKAGELSRKESCYKSVVETFQSRMEKCDESKKNYKSISIVCFIAPLVIALLITGQCLLNGQVLPLNPAIFYTIAVSASAVMGLPGAIASRFKKNESNVNKTRAYYSSLELNVCKNEIGENNKALENSKDKITVIVDLLYNLNIMINALEIHLSNPQDNPTPEFDDTFNVAVENLTKLDEVRRQEPSEAKFFLELTNK